MATTETTEQVMRDLPRRTLPGWASSIRLRLLVSFVVVLTLATAGSVFVVRGLLLHRLDEQIDSDLVQEASELHKLAQGNDPRTGRPFGGDVRRIFQVFLQRNIPARYEAQVTFVDGEPFLRSRRVAPYRLDTDPSLVARWGDLTTSQRGRVETPEGAVDYLAVPLESPGSLDGVFVVAVFRDLAAEETEPAIAGAAGVGLLVLVIGSFLAWRVADRILHPVTRVIETARNISETDLRQRIDVAGDDEIARLGHAFNEMLDRLEHAFAMQRRFIDDAGHELRTPITIIQGQLETLEDDPEDRRKTLEVVMDELDRMARFVNDLLLLSRAQRPDFLALEATDVAMVTDELYAKASSLAPRGWHIESVGRGRVVMDRQRITQAVMQLAQNAVQHTSENGAITLGSAVLDGEARFWVQDEGEGIPPSRHQEIFERFRRGAGSQASDGAGLGLSIVKAIAEAHHGRVELASRAGAGSTFTVVIPVDQPSPPVVEDPL
ncbi:MAG: HAMP domain-containing histidine kinase [Actinomycetota bacterium]|nr:HAMP domain-containing histidine kinase [Actinomycetota bacterium]